jgi:DNA-binding transcriptional regulator YiaG
MTDPITFRSLRKQARLSQSGLAELWGLHRVTISRWETGEADIPRWAMRLIEHEVIPAPPR